MTTTETREAAVSEALRRVEEARERLARAPGDDASAGALIDALEALVDHEEAQGTPDGALAAAEEQVAIARDALARAPDDPARLRRLVVCVRCVGDVQRTRDDLESALAAHEEAVTLARRAVALAPGDTEAAWLLSVSLNRVGMVQESRKGEDDALFAAWSESLQIVRGLVAREPDQTRWLEALVTDLANVAWIHDARESPEEKELARSMLEERIAIGRRLMELEPDEPERLFDLLVSLDDLGDLHGYREAWDLARAAHEEAVHCGRRLVARQPDEPRWRSTLSVSANKLGHTHRARGDLDAALAAFREGLGCARALVDRADRVADGPASLGRFCLYLEEVADQFTERRELDRARAVVEETLSARRGLAEREPEDRELRAELTICLRKISILRRRCGDEAGELAAEDEIERIRGDLAADPEA